MFKKYIQEFYKVKRGAQKLGEASGTTDKILTTRMVWQNITYQVQKLAISSPGNFQYIHRCSYIIAVK